MWKNFVKLFGVLGGTSILKELQDVGRNSLRRCSIKNVFLIFFGKFTGKHLRQSVSFNKVVSLIFFIENECETPIGCLIFIGYQNC